MKTGNVPALVTLAAAAVYCIIGLYNQTGAIEFARDLLIIIIVFYVFGSILKIILDKFFKEPDESKVEEEESSETSEDEKEDIRTDDE